MTPADVERFERAMEKTAAAYPNFKPDDGLAEVYLEDLQRLSIDEFEKAIAQARGKSSFFPSIADILEASKELDTPMPAHEYNRLKRAEEQRQLPDVTEGMDLRADVQEAIDNLQKQLASKMTPPDIRKYAPLTADRAPIPDHHKKGVMPCLHKSPVRKGVMCTKILDHEDAHGAGDFEWVNAPHLTVI